MQLVLARSRWSVNEVGQTLAPLRLNLRFFTSRVSTNSTSPSLSESITIMFESMVGPFFSFVDLECLDFSLVVLEVGVALKKLYNVLL